MRDVTGADLVKLVQEAYDLSRPQGLGILHFTPGPLPSAEAELYVKPSGHIAVSADYIRGRSVKLTVFRGADGRLTVDDDWYDHSASAYEELWQRVGVIAAAEEPS